MLAAASDNPQDAPMTAVPRRQLIDTIHRPLRDLRISVTDRCNFRCTYCMPKEVFGPDFAFLPHQQLLSFEEITRLTRIFVANGVRKVRLTGGEPLLRKNLEQLVSMLTQIDGLEDIAVTTNGSMLTLEKAKALKAAGLKRITVSLDSLDDKTFMALNDVHFPVSKVLDAIHAADAAGLAPVKINMVVKRGSNENSILDMARYFRGTSFVLRFIEFMDVGNSNGWQLDQVVQAAEIIDIISKEWPIEALPPTHPGEVASRYRYLDGQGEFGIIASVSHAFCGTCNRVRLSSEGLLYTCLFASRGHDFRAMLREGKSDQEISDFLAWIWGGRTDRYSELRSEATKHLRKVEMSHIGG